MKNFLGSFVENIFDVNATVVGVVLSLSAYTLTEPILEDSERKFLSETKSQQK